MTPIKAILLIFLVVSAVSVCVTKRMLTTVIIFISYGIVMSVLWILLSAPDLAITEAAVGSGISGVLFVVVLKRIRIIEKEYHERDEGKLRLKWFPDSGGKMLHLSYIAAAFIVCLGLTAVLIYTASCLPPFGDPGNPANNEVVRKYLEEGVKDTGAINIVAGIILEYRAFDTFGEACLLFAAICAILIMLYSEDPPDAFDSFLLEMDEPRQNVILKNISFLLVAMTLIFGCYSVINGHLTPGGGFSGGAILGAALILYASAYGTKRARNFINYKVFCRIISICLIFYALIKGFSFFTGANHIDFSIPLGTPGNLFSAGLILPLNIAVGLIVAVTAYVIYVLFSNGELK